MSTVMGNLVQTEDDSYIVQREDGTWLIDGATPIEDLERTLELDKMPDDESYETVAGFMMYMLRKIPKLTDKVIYSGYKFEVIDVDMNRIDQILVSKIETEQTNKEEKQGLEKKPEN
ncbi:transporter associated domain-containing protein [Turicimonas muris]|nr:transporter associated domain-containing protein [Turicimonas muris]